MAESSPAEEPSGLPTWLDEMLKPGVGKGVFNTLKLSLVGLVLVLCGLLVLLEDAVRASELLTLSQTSCALCTDRSRAWRPQYIRMHVGIFLGMSIVLLVLIIWFIGMLAEIEVDKEKAVTDKKTE